MADAMKLLPCPMCGGEAALLDYEARYGGLHYASRCPQCTSCGCSMGYLPTAKKAVEAWNCRASMPAPEKAPSFDDARCKLIHCIEQWDGETEYDAEDIAALADDILDIFSGPPAREEAPAEGAKTLGWFSGLARKHGYHDQADWLDAYALRNRTSEPEAIKQAYKRGWNDRESDIIERAESMGCTSEPEAGAVAPYVGETADLIDQLRLSEGNAVTIMCDNPDFNGQPNSAVEIVADWTNWQTVRFTGENVIEALRNARDRVGGKIMGECASLTRIQIEQVLAHPAPATATADKLRVAKEALVRAKAALSNSRAFMEIRIVKTREAIAQALAALNEQTQ